MNTRKGTQLGALALALSLALSACAASPESTYTNASGESVTVTWSGYPASAWLGADEILAGPRASDVPESSERMLAEMRVQLAEEFDVTEWAVSGEPQSEGDWFRMHGNEYGGESLLVTFNSPGWDGEASIPSAEWERVVDAVAAVAGKFGLDERWHDTDLTPPFDQWMRSETLTRGSGSEWVSVVVQDANLDPSREALTDAAKHGWLVSGISISYGITTVHDQDLSEFQRRAAPFAGLERPEASHPS